MRIVYRRPAWIEVDLGAIAANVRALRSLLSPGTELMAVVKANGYGHGRLPVARAALAAGADRLGVALLEEGERLRRAHVGEAPIGRRARFDRTSVPVQILGELPPEGAPRAVAAGLDVTTGRRETVDALAGAARSAGRPARVHLKVDTGMRRIGCQPSEALELAARITDDPHLVLAGVMTHFATSEDPAGEAFRSQAALWNRVRETLEGARIVPEAWHAANSGATILSPQTHGDLVRCGIAIYGLHPGEATRRVVDLIPALSLFARISEVKPLKAGQSVSYGHAWTAQNATDVATLPIGYGDGYTRRLSNLASAAVRGRRMPVVGAITMDQCLLAAPPGAVSVGDVATLIGDEVPADELAELAGTINYEITCMLNNRLPRRYRRAAGEDEA